MLHQIGKEKPAFDYQMYYGIWRDCTLWQETLKILTRQKVKICLGNLEVIHIE
jgi:hypothetical protein